MVKRVSKWVWLVAGGCLLAGVYIGLTAQFSGRTQSITSFTSCAVAGYPVSDTNPPACRAPGQVFTGPLEPSSAPGPEQAVQPLTLLVQGDTGNTSSRQQITIHTPSEWQAFWNQVHANANPMPPLLNIDFTQHDVVAVVDGPQTTTGFGLKIVNVLAGPGTVTVNVVRQVPTITCQVEQKTSNRYYIVATSKLATPPLFKISTDYRRCSP